MAIHNLLCQVLQVGQIRSLAHFSMGAPLGSSRLGRHETNYDPQYINLHTPHQPSQQTHHLTWTTSPIKPTPTLPTTSAISSTNWRSKPPSITSTLYEASPTPRPPDTQASQHTWQGDWPEYLQTARAANATLLYIRADPFDLEQENTLLSLTQRATHIQQLRPTSPPSQTTPTESEQGQWLLQRLMEQTQPFRQHNHHIGSIQCLWFLSGIAHSLTITTPWYQSYQSTVTHALDEAESVEIENRRLHSEEVSIFLMELARELAAHERFPEASNNEKRLYMADQLFPGLDLPQRTEVVSLAQVTYWWDIAPAETATKEQQARDLRARGETIKNISLLLKIPEARVRAILDL